MLPTADLRELLRLCELRLASFERLFDLHVVGDVFNRADVTGAQSGAVEDNYPARLGPANGFVRPEKTKLILQHSGGADRRHAFRHNAVTVLRMDELREAFAERLSAGESGERL